VITALLDVAPRWHYAGVLLACLAVTLPLEVVLGARVYRRPARLAATIALASGPFLVWDWFATAAGHWSFSERHTLGVDIGGRLPVEEVAFFVVIPICALLTHEVVRGALGPGRRRRG
jgi:lycopene beta-cyclase